MDEPWIGDWVIHKSTQRKGIFEGMEGSRARVKMDDEYFFFTLEELEVIEDPGEEEIWEWDEPTPTPYPEQVSTQIDLHIEQLAPDRTFDSPIMILKHQMDRCRQYIQAAIDSQLLEFEIIHGKGEGVLAREVENELANYSKILKWESIHEGGALLCKRK